MASREERLLLRFATAVTLLGLLHHLDHWIRGNHVGWPVIETVTPFTGSLLIYALLIPGLWFGWRGKISGAYWFLVAAAGLLLVLFVHFVPLPNYESPGDVFLPYAQPELYCSPTFPGLPVPEFRRSLFCAGPGSWWGVLAGFGALFVLWGLVASLAGTMIQSWKIMRNVRR